MVTEKMIIGVEGGLHVKAATVLCNTASRYHSRIDLSIGSITANAKSVLGVLGACIKAGDTVEFCCDGIDEDEALAGIREVVQNDFRENTED